MTLRQRAIVRGAVIISLILLFPPTRQIREVGPNRNQRQFTAPAFVLGSYPNRRNIDWPLFGIAIGLTFVICAGRYLYLLEDPIKSRQG